MENNDIEKLAYELYPPNIEPYMEGIVDWNLNIRKAFVENYKLKKISGYTYTDEHINYIRNILVDGALTNMSCASAIVELDKYINSLNTQKI